MHKGKEALLEKSRYSRKMEHENVVMLMMPLIVHVR